MESKAHIELVNRIMAYTKKLVPPSCFDLIICDSAGQNSDIRVIGNFIPDVYYRDNNCLIIGEAKTLDDFERKHSMEQFDAYLKECQVYGNNSTLIIAVPWQLVVTAKNYFKRKKTIENYSFEIIIVNEIGMEINV